MESRQQAAPAKYAMDKLKREAIKPAESMPIPTPKSNEVR